MKAALKYIVDEFKGWSPFLYFVDGGVSVLVPYVFGLLAHISFWQQMGLFALVLLVVTSSIAAYRDISHQRLRRTAARIRALADSINISGLSVGPARTIGPRRDPVKEANVELTAMVKTEVVASYQESLQMTDPNVAAKLFLSALADSLSVGHLR
jgi:hypothetical protein